MDFGVFVLLIVNILVAAVGIWIASKLNLGLSVDGYGSAIKAAIVIGSLITIVFWLWSKLPPISF